MEALQFNLFRTFKNTVVDLMYKSKDLARKDVSNKLMIYGSERKNGGIPLIGGKKLCVKYTF